MTVDIWCRQDVLIAKLKGVGPDAWSVVGFPFQVRGETVHDHVNEVGVEVEVVMDVVGDRCLALQPQGAGVRCALAASL